MAVKLDSARVARNVGVTRGIRLNRLGLPPDDFVTARPRYPFRMRLSETQVRC